MSDTRIEVWPPDSPGASALNEAVEILTCAGFPQEELWLGGGAVLAARWRHRQDDNVRLFVHSSDMERRLPAIISAVRQTARERGKTQVTHGPRWAEWQAGPARAGIYTSTPTRKPWLAPQKEARHGIATERTRATLDKKIQGRMANLGDIRWTDLMDIAASMSFDPQALRDAMWLAEIGDGKTLAREIRFLHSLEPREPATDAPQALADSVARHMESRTWDTALDQRTLPAWWPALAPQPPRMEVPEADATWLPALETMPETPETSARSAFAPEEDEEWEPQPFAQMEKDMAGSPLNPEPEEIRDWIREERPDRIGPDAHGWLCDAFAQLKGADAMAFRQRCGASLVEIARAAHRTQPLGRTFRIWLNRYARRVEQRHIEQFEGYATLGGPRSAA